MSDYVYILATDRPAPIGLDENRRVVYSVNFQARAAAEVNALEEEIAARLVSEGAATALNTDVFVGPSAVLPRGDGPYVQINDDGGPAPQAPHNAGTATDEMISFQIAITARTYVAARTRALAVWRALHGVYNTTLAA